MTRQPSQEIIDMIEELFADQIALAEAMRGASIADAVGALIANFEPMELTKVIEGLEEFLEYAASQGRSSDA